jgi:hypothetical protein
MNEKLVDKSYDIKNVNTHMRHITTFRSTTDRIYDGGLIILKYLLLC